MKKITANEGKKYTDKAYSFFTDIIYAPDSAVTDEYFEIDENDVQNIQDSKANIELNSIEDLEQITSNIEQINEAKQLNSKIICLIGMIISINQCLKILNFNIIINLIKQYNILM